MSCFVSERETDRVLYFSIPIILTRIKSKQRTVPH
jgi:hypothetical protein